MKISLIAIGNKMPDWISTGYSTYSKRLPPEISLHLVEIPATKRTKNTDLMRLIQQEGIRLLQAVPSGDQIIALTERGTLWNTFTFAKKLQNWQKSSLNISLLVGGPEGLSQLCLDKAHLQWSLSPLTWPHPLVRIMIAEQIYRAWSILSSHPYHRI